MAKYKTLKEKDEYIDQREKRAKINKDLHKNTRESKRAPQNKTHYEKMQKRHQREKPNYVRYDDYLQQKRIQPHKHLEKL